MGGCSPPRAARVGRCRRLDVFAYDPVATALAKIARGRPADITDVLALVQAGQLRLDMLTTALDEILLRVAAGEATCPHVGYL